MRCGDSLMRHACQPIEHLLRVENSYLSQAQQYLNSASDYVLNNNLTPSNYANVTIYSYDPSGMIPKCGANLTSSLGNTFRRRSS